MAIIASDSRIIVIGLGKTGLSCARYFARKGIRFSVADTRETPPNLAAFQAEFPSVEVRCGALDGDWLKSASELVVSPGIAIATPEIAAAAEAGVNVVGDIELFCREVTAPIAAITGSNAKSTVTQWLGEMAKADGIDVAVAGNIGTPVLDLLATGEQAMYILELSSFQLETTHSLKAKAATVLNVSPDHMDRYDSLMHYYNTKQRIYLGSELAVVNGDDPLSRPLMRVGMKTVEFRNTSPDFGRYGVAKTPQGPWLASQSKRYLPLSELKVKGSHNVSNALAAIAMAEGMGISEDAIVTALKSFPGLEHRCQWVGDYQGVAFYNDSKGTNVGATQAALEGLGAGEGKLVLIAGGVGKGADFSPLKALVARYCRGLVLIGEDANAIDEAVGFTATDYAASTEEALEKAFAMAQEGDAVLLSPACASFDMYKSFEHRGECFVAAFKELAQ
ncbi:MAG: UDP-N-acetylmuramoyl-L-alanine--D-glutamate ligase [Pontibacterium sp.]